MVKNQNISNVAYDQLNKDADRILQLIKVQMDNLTLPQCPLYEEVLDTQMFGLQKEVDFAVQLGLVDREVGKDLMLRLEKELSNTGVKVTNISPGMVETPLSSESPFEEGRKKLSPDDIAEAVVYATTQPSHVNVNEILVRPS